MFDVRPLKRWDNFVDEVDGLDGGWLFRGQSDTGCDLITSLERHTPPDYLRSVAERRLIQDFKSRAHVFLEPHQVPHDTGEWVALMQHFGAPTRLLDVTKSPYVAIYFAVEDAVKTDCAVWAFNRSQLVDALGELFLAAHTDLIPPLERLIAAHQLKPNRPTAHKTLAGFLETERSPDDWFDSKNHLAAVMPFAPRRLSERLSVQQGEFLVPRDVDATFMDNFAAATKVGVRALKFVMPKSERPRILGQLRRMNGTRASLFPGLEGFAQSFRQSLIEESPEARTQRAKLRGLRQVLSQEGAGRVFGLPGAQAAGVSIVNKDNYLGTPEILLGNPSRQEPEES